MDGNWRYCAHSGFLECYVGTYIHVYMPRVHFACVCAWISSCKYVNASVSSFCLLKAPRSKDTAAAATRTVSSQRVFPTKGDQDHSEKRLVPSLGQGGCKMSLEHGSKPESKAVHVKHNGVSGKDWGDSPKAPHGPTACSQSTQYQVQ